MFVKLYMRPAPGIRRDHNKQRTLWQFIPIMPVCASALAFPSPTLLKASNSPGTHNRIYKSKSAYDNALLIAMYRQYNVT